MNIIFTLFLLSGWVANSIVSMLLVFIYYLLRKYSFNKITTALAPILLDIAILQFIISVMPLMILAESDSGKLLFEILLTLYSFVFIYKAIKFINKL